MDKFDYWKEIKEILKEKGYELEVGDRQITVFTEGAYKRKITELEERVRNLEKSLSSRSERVIGRHVVIEQPVRYVKLPNFSEILEEQKKERERRFSENMKIVTSTGFQNHFNAMIRDIRTQNYSKYNY